jgi:TonB family protein
MFEPRSESKTSESETLESKSFGSKTSVPKTLVRKTDRLLPSAPPSRHSDEPKQRQLMVTALVLLLVSLGFVLYRDRDFWFPNTQPNTQEASQEQTVPAPAHPVQQTVLAAKTEPVISKKSRSSKTQPPFAGSKIAGRKIAGPQIVGKKIVGKQIVEKQTAPPEIGSQTDPPAPPLTATTQRTVLPPLEVEVIAGDVHRTLQPGTNSVHVDLQPGSDLQSRSDLQPESPPQSASEPSASSNAETSASVTSNAAERVQISADSADVVTHSVKPDYPLLARQMKVQGSVILQAWIGRDGLIQDLRILSGPPILASAAEEAVRQWHFKPRYRGADAVETQTRITVNFTISTN